MEPARNLVAVVPGSFVSGAELLLLRDLAAARAAGWGVAVACSDGPLVDTLAEAGIDRIAIPDLRLGSGPRMVAWARVAVASLRAARTLRRASFGGHGARPNDALVLVNGVNALPAGVLGAAKRPVVYFVHDVLVRRDRIALVRLARRRLRGAIAVSDAAAAPIQALGIRTVVTRQGTEWPVAGGAGRSQPPCVGIAAALSPWKGQSVLLEAASRLSHPSAIVEVMGATPPKDRGYEFELRRQARTAGLDGRVRFLGHLTDPLERMRTWTVAVVASTDPEAGPLTALEAMSVGVPVVATDHGGVREVLGDAGLLVPPGSAAALAGAIDRLLDDRELYARCAAAGPKRIVDEHLTRTAHEERFVTALSDLARAP